MIEVTVTHAVTQPTATVFDYVAEPVHLPDWDVAVVDARRMFEGPPKLGTRAWTMRRFPGWQAEVVWEITAFEPPQRFELRTVSGPYPMRALYFYTATPANGTSIELQLEVEVENWLDGFSPFISMIIRQELEQSLRQLEQRLGQHPTAT